MRTRLALAAMGALIVAIPRPVHAVADRPNRLADEAGCDRYEGVPIGANDSTQQFELIVCPTATGVRGKVQTSSLVSGWSVRASVGTWDVAGRVLTMSETEFIESRPEPDWRFCLIDELVLERTATGLEGHYWSKDCDDRAELVLELIEPAPVPDRPQGPSATAKGASTPERGPTPPVERYEGSCACHSAGERGAWWLGLAVVVLFGRRTSRIRASKKELPSPRP